MTLRRIGKNKKSIYAKIWMLFVSVQKALSFHIQIMDLYSVTSQIRRCIFYVWFIIQQLGHFIKKSNGSKCASDGTSCYVQSTRGEILKLLFPFRTRTILFSIPVAPGCPDQPCRQLHRDQTLEKMSGVHLQSAPPLFVLLLLIPLLSFFLQQLIKRFKGTEDCFSMPRQ